MPQKENAAVLLGFESVSNCQKDCPQWLSFINAGDHYIKKELWNVAAWFESSQQNPAKHQAKGKE